VELEAIACAEGMQFEVAPLSGCEARLIRDANGQGFARISNTIREPGRIRFALAHELGHFALHIGQSQAHSCTSGDMADYKNKPLEIEANIFAGELLMPRVYFKNLIAHSGPTFEEFGLLAEKFNVSLTAAALRYIDLGPLHDISLVCIGRDKKVKWSKCRSGSWEFWIEPGTPISHKTMAHCAFTAEDRVDSTRVDSYVWFPKIYGIEVMEQCLYMPEYRSVLALLVIERV
jgi:hypothetical protein